MTARTEHTTRSNNVIIPDEIIDASGRTQRRNTALRGSERHLRFIDRVILVLLAIVIVVVTGVIAVGAAVLVAVLIVIGLVVRGATSLWRRAGLR